MSGKRCGSAAQLIGALGRARSHCVSETANCLFSALVVACMAVNSLAVAASAEATGAHSVGAITPHSKALVKKQDISCDVPEASENLSVSQQKLYNRSCLVSLSAVDKLRVQKDFSFVDVRSSAEYDHYRIATSINIPLHLVKTKVFLKKLPVVLVNDGRSTTELEKACGELKQAGFEHVSVLDGGLFAWYASKRPLEGDPMEQSKLNRMSAEELFEVHSLANWVVIDVSTPGKNSDISTWLPKKIIASPYKSKDDSITKISSAISQQRKKNPLGKLLLIADNDDVYERIDARLKKSGVTSGVLFLNGGVKGYREHVKKQLAMWSHQNELNRPRRYVACPG